MVGDTSWLEVIAVSSLQCFATVGWVRRDIQHIRNAPRNAWCKTRGGINDNIKLTFEKSAFKQEDTIV